MQTNGRGSRRGRFGKIGLSVLGAIVFTASSAWAVPFTGAAQGFFTVNIVYGPDGTFSHTIGTNTLRGYTTAGGAMVCHGVQMGFEFLQEPTGACGAEEIEAVGTTHWHCQFEGTEDIFHAIGTNTGCTPPSCLDENGNPQVGCTFTVTESITAAGGTGIAEGSSGSWTFSSTGTYTQAGVTGPEGFFIFAGTASFELEGDFEFADGSIAPADAALEIPSPGTNVSGVGLVSGWSCLGGELTVEFSDENGAVLDHLTQTVLQGTEREDTEGACGDINNGFSSLFNWSRLGSGERTARLIRNGEEIASSTFMVTAFDDDFVTEAEGMCTIPNFPDMGTNATFVWETSQQGLVLESVN